MKVKSGEVEVFYSSTEERTPGVWMRVHGEFVNSAEAFLTKAQIKKLIAKLEKAVAK